VQHGPSVWSRRAVHAVGLCPWSNARTVAMDGASLTAAGYDCQCSRDIVGDDCAILAFGSSTLGTKSQPILPCGPVSTIASVIH
jgi:hypothetical protein